MNTRMISYVQRQSKKSLTWCSLACWIQLLFCIGVVNLSFAQKPIELAKKEGKAHHNEGFDDEDFDDEGFDDEGFDDGGFGDLSELEIQPSALPPPPSALRIDGFTRSQWASWILRPLEKSWAKGRQNLDVSVKYKKVDWLFTADGHVEYDLLYDLDDGPFDPVQEEEYRMRYIPGVQSISKRISLGHFGLTLSTGRQIITWGESDGLSALDVINSQDQREPGVSDIDDIKLAVWLSRLQLAQNQHSFELIVRHEGHYGILVPPQADYSPFNAIMSRQSAMIPAVLLEQLQNKEFRFTHDHEGVSVDTQSYFLRYQYRGEGFDLGIYGASLLDVPGVIGPMDLTQLIDPTQNQVNIAYQHPRYSLLGLTLALPMGNWLFKTEAVTNIDRPVNVGEGNDINQLKIDKANTLTSVFGLTYSGWTDSTLSIEYQRGFLLSEAPNADFFIPPTLDILVLRANRTFWRERLSASLVTMMIAPRWSSPQRFYEPKRGGLLRVDTSYRLLDQLKLSLGYIHYMTGQDFGPFYGLDDHDRVFTQLRWDFTVY